MKAWASNRWLWRILGAILAGIIIWFVGPLIAIADFRPLGWWPVTLVFALLPLLIVGVLWLLGRRRAARENAKLVEALAPPSAASREAEEVAAKLREALTMLKSTKLGSKGAYLYQLPWYVIVGPSKAGKTTALLNSGLNFPTAVAGEYKALRGQPNTPNCDWWFTDEAVLIDTAGRYIAQDEDATRDAEGWRGFLALLKQHRPLQPLNGVIVAVPAPDFADPRMMAMHAQNIRTRLAELGTALGQDLPIYLLVTKTDLLPGFREYFARSDDAEANQVFGSTAPGDRSDNDAVLRGFDGLVTGISARTVDRMQNEPDIARRAQIAAFPAQLASLRAPIAALMAALTQESRFDKPARLRGVYLASAIQSGSPVDRILLTVGMPPAASADAVGRGRSYFLRRFFSDLVFPEAGLAGRNVAAERRARQRYFGAAIASGLALVVAIGVWTWGYFRNTAIIQTVYATASRYAEAAGNNRGGTANPSEDLAALDVLGDATKQAADASDFGLGLGQGSRLTREISAIYGRDLQRRLLPLLGQLAESRLASDAAAPALLYDDLKSYLILGGKGPLLGPHLLGWAQPAWAAQSSSEAEAGAVARHTAALLDGNFRPIGVDAARITQAQLVLRAQPAAVRVYGRLKSKALAGDEPMWTAQANAGPRPEIFFASTGAFAPGSGIPALFTRTGYDKSFVPMLASGPALLEEETWVVGDTGPVNSRSPAEIAALKRDLERLYFDEFLGRWRAYLAAIQPRPATSLADNVQRLRDGSGPLTPIKPLLVAVARATDMTPPKGLAAPAGLAGKLLGAAGMGPSADDPRDAVVREFLPLRMFVGNGKAPAPIDAMLTTMNSLADKLGVIAVLPGGGGESGSAASLEVRALIGQLDQTGVQMPPPANVLVRSVASDANVALGGARTAQFSSAVGASFGDNCAAVIGRGFPVVPASASDIPLADFSRFFKQGGAFETFTKQELAGYLDTTGADWRPQPNAAEIGLGEADVRALQAAALVTRLFFGADPAAPRLTYQIEPVALAGATKVTLRIDDQTLTFDGKTPVPSTFDWPGAGNATVEFTTGSSAPEVRSWPGPWAVFRMMRAAAVKSAGTAASGVGSLTQGGARFDFRVRALGAGNPFVVDPFVKVACPAARPKG
ncbi:hypothetical protein IP88_08305 [alpha proteobacterium AAP81b]|nr:hypothetical protein IP88_08305 [alpha proteobacterium AAP81b]